MASILVVDDDPDIRSFISLALGTGGHEVREARNGRDALDLLAGWRPDAILLDLMMPVMDGWAFRTAQREDPAHAAIPVVVVSASRRVGATLEALAPAAVVAKPFDVDALLDTLERVMQRRRATDS